MSLAGGPSAIVLDHALRDGLVGFAAARPLGTGRTRLVRSYEGTCLDDPLADHLFSVSFGGRGGGRRRYGLQGHDERQEWRHDAFPFAPPDRE